MTHQALPAQTARPRTVHSSRRTVGSLQLVPLTQRSRSPRTPSKLPRMSELAIDTGDHGRIIDLSREPDAANRLPRGRAGGRYRCCACGNALIFTGPATPDSAFTPRFRHPGSPGTDRCTAPAPHQADIQSDLTTVLDLRERLARALPGTVISLTAQPQLAGQRWTLPPALVIHQGDQAVVVERPRRPLTKTTAETRLQHVRATYGERTAHWWFFDRDDTQQYLSAGTVKVRPHGTPGTHPKVRPTPAQRQLVHNGAAVCWIAKDTVLIPYGGHPGTYPAHDGEDWSGEMASWAKDWKVSHPYPADSAAWWGLVPLPLLTFGAHTGFRPAPAFQVMHALEKAQKGRETHRRRLAREHAQRPKPETTAVATASAPTEASSPHPSSQPAPAPAPVEASAVHRAPEQASQAVQPPPADGPPLQKRAQVAPIQEPGSHPRFTWRALLRLLRPGKTSR